ncbi:MAG: SPFH/Band 7/PHB domain protein [Coriobacteriales bacterium]|nr:SPFH/Band 7/PHB domain protein [Coriobacteriales bacterium]
MLQTIGAVFIGIIVFIFALVYLARAVRIVRPFEKAIVERLGKYQKTYEPGLHVIVPFLDKLTKVDMRENVVDVPAQEVITKDNVVVTVDAVVYYEATDPVKLNYNVKDFYLAATKLAQTNLRNVVGEMQLDESLTSREKINATLRQILDDATDKWGVRVVRVELQRIEPPVDITEAMHRQMKAERDRRALILESEGDRQAAINRAEGSKQSAILEAEGRATAIKQVAEAERFQKVAVANGEAEAIALVYGAIHAGQPTPDLLAVRYLDALPLIANGQATKVFLPYEISGVLGAIGGIAEAFASGVKPVSPTHPSAGGGAPGPMGSGGVTPPPPA